MQGSEIPVSGTLLCTYPKWADLGKMGKMGENGGKCGKFWMPDGKMGNFGAEKVKKHGFDWQQGYGGGALVKAPKEKWGETGENGEKWGKMGGNGENCGKFWMLDGTMGNLGAEKVKKHGFDWQQGYGGGGASAEAPKEKWGKMGNNGETKPVHPSPTLFVICPHLPP